MLKIQKYKWPNRIRRHHLRVPWGYEADKEDNDLLLPVDEQLDALEYAKMLYSNGCSSREVARWLTEYTGVSLSHAGLIERIKIDNRDFRQDKRDQDRESDSKETGECGSEVASA